MHLIPYVLTYLNTLNTKYRYWYQVYYYNGDLKEVDGSGETRYLYHKTQTWHTKHTDGRETTVFSNGQTEVTLSLVSIKYVNYFLFLLQEKFPDGRQIISFSDGTRKVISAGGEEEISFPDKTLVIRDSRGERVVRLPQSDNIRRNVRKSLKTTLESRIEKGNSSSKVSLPPQPQQRDVMVL